LFSIHPVSQPRQPYEELIAVSPHQNENEVNDLAEHGVSGSNLYAQMEKPRVQHHAVSDQCNVYDKLATSSVEDPADCYSKLDRDKQIENTAIYAVVAKKVRVEANIVQ